MKVTPDRVMQAVEEVMGNIDKVFWVDTDCCKAATDTYNYIFGYNPMGNVGDMYSGEEGAKEFIRVSGGLGKLMSDNFVPQGFEETQQHKPTALTLLDDTKGNQFMGICVEDGIWAVKTSVGFALLRGNPIISYYNKMDNR